jgi:hypothetical protein
MTSLKNPPLHPLVSRDNLGGNGAQGLVENRLSVD